MSLGGSYPDLDLEAIMVYSLFILFLVGVLFSWFNKLATGIIFFVWNVGMWFLEMSLVKENGGIGVIFGVPLIILGAFFILEGIQDKRGEKLNKKESWILVLQSLSIIYTILFLLNITAKLTQSPEIISLNLQGGFVLLNISLFFIGFVISWRKKLFAGFAFILWYFITVYLDLSNPELFGGSFAFGLAVLVQGVLYVVFHYKYKINVTRKLI